MAPLLCSGLSRFLSIRDQRLALKAVGFSGAENGWRTLGIQKSPRPIHVLKDGGVYRDDAQRETWRPRTGSSSQLPGPVAVSRTAAIETQALTMEESS